MIRFKEFGLRKSSGFKILSDRDEIIDFIKKERPSKFYPIGLLCCSLKQDREPVFVKCYSGAVVSEPDGPGLFNKILKFLSIEDFDEFLSLNESRVYSRYENIPEKYDKILSASSYVLAIKNDR